MMHYEDYTKYVEKQVDRSVPVIQAVDKGTLSFTPYISNLCSACCRFCSERLSAGGMNAARLSVCDHYRDKLVRAFLYARSRPIFLSVSGIEPSESVDQLALVSEAVRLAEQEGCVFTDRVMYSNLSGFTKEWDRLAGLVRDLKLTRIESSRHHYDEDVNQRIVRFRPGETNRTNRVFGETVRRLLPVVPVTFACVIQKSGISTAADVLSYLDFARSLGVERVVFRELSVFSEEPDNSEVASYITANRVEIMDILQALQPGDFRPLSVTRGYYYYSFLYQYRGMHVLFEMSDYDQMIREHYGDRLHKLIFYADGSLCRDWNMKGKIDLEE